MPQKPRKEWQRPFKWPPNTWEFTPGLQLAADIFTWLIFLALSVTVIGALVTWPFLIIRTFEAVFHGTADDIRNILLAVGALVGVPFLIWRTLIASKQTEISRESHYTALFTKAVEQLGAEKTVKRREFRQKYRIEENTNKILRDKDGKPIPALSANGEPLGEYESYEITVTNYEVRLGAIYALERIAQDSTRDSGPIYLTLCAYVQNNSPAVISDFKDTPSRQNNSDIEEIFNVLTRYAKNRKDEVNFAFENIHIPELILKETALTKLSFRKCSAIQMYFRCRVDQVNFQDCRLGEIILNEIEHDDVSFVDGSIDFLKINNSVGKTLNIISVSIKSLTVITSTFDDSDFHLGNSAINFYLNTFRSCLFQNAERSYGIRSPDRWDGNRFVDCEFVNCDFSFQDLSKSKFEHCQFHNCNLIQIGAINGDSNTFSRCFTEVNVRQEPGKPITELDLRTQWIDWRYNSGNGAV